MNRYLWSYEISKLPLKDLLHAKDLLISKFSITDIFLSMSEDLHPLELDKLKLSKVIEIINPINIHAMILQDNNYIDLSQSNEEIINSNLISLKNYNQEFPKYKIKGIHIDVEPHTRNDFKLGNEKNVINAYIKLIKFIRSRLEFYDFTKDNDFIFSAATGWRYESRDMLSISNLGKFIDCIVPMAYNTGKKPVCGIFSRIISKLPFELWNRRCPQNSGYIVGLGLEEFDDINSTIERLEKWIYKNSLNKCYGISLFSDKWIIESY